MKLEWINFGAGREYRIKGTHFIILHFLILDNGARVEIFKWPSSTSKSRQNQYKMWKAGIRVTTVSGFQT